MTSPPSSADIRTLFGAGPSAGIDFHQGQVLTWNPSDNTSTVRVLGTVLNDLPVLSSGAVLLGVGDSVGILKIKSQYFILGRVSTVQQGLRPRSARLDPTTFTVSGATYTGSAPVLTDVYIGPSRSCIMWLGATISLHGANGTGLTRSGFASVEITGNSGIPASTFESFGSVPSLTVGPGTNATTYSSGVVPVTAVDGLYEGLHTFTMKYRNASPDPGTSATFLNASLTVLPI